MADKLVEIWHRLDPCCLRKPASAPATTLETRDDSTTALMQHSANGMTHVARAKDRNDLHCSVTSCPPTGHGNAQAQGPPMAGACDDRLLGDLAPLNLAAPTDRVNGALPDSNQFAREHRT